MKYIYMMMMMIIIIIIIILIITEHITDKFPGFTIPKLALSSVYVLIELQGKTVGD